MKLKRLEIQGFKSFADRTVFDFDDGVTVVVGPNGCGKSNVVDAVKWVLGEQRPTSLRGKEMLDVIFNGAKTRRAQGMAEVAVVFDNRCGTLPVDYAEVVVSRRLHRDGQSEYRLNGNPCRLRDIRETFLDTGTGVEAYAIMEQGRIDALLQSNPKDRRSIFDEAAGISRYKARRKEAQRKLEKVEANLERLQDVLDLTLKRQHSVKVQAGRARRYQEISEELNGLRVRFAMHRYHLLLGERRTAAERIEGLLGHEREASEKLGTLHGEIRTSEGEVEAAAARHREAENELASAVGEIRSAKERIEYAGRLQAELDERIAAAEAEIERGHRVLGELDARVAGGEIEVAQTEAELAERRQAVEAFDRDCAERRTALDRLRNERETIRRETLAAIGAAAGARNRRARCEADLEGLDGRSERLLARVAETGREESKLRAAAVDAGRVAAAATTRVDDEAEGVRRRTEGVEAARRDAEAKRVALEAAGRELAAVRSRLDVLEALRANREGVSSGVKAVLQAAAAGGVLGGIKGVVADYLEVDREHARAVEAVLGDRAEAVVAETLDDALGAIEYLRRERLGRATFLALDQVDVSSRGLGAGEAGDPASDRSRLPEGARVTSELVRSRNGCGDALMAALLDDAIIVDDAAGARGLVLRNAGGRRHRVVTGGGDLFDPRGFVTGGGGCDEDAGGLVARAAEIRELTESLRNLSVRRDALRDERARADGRRDELETALGEARDRLVALRDHLARRRAEAERLDRDFARVSETLALDRAELVEIESEREDARSRIVELDAELDRLDRERAALEARGEGLDAEAAAAAEAVSQAEEERTELRIAVARASERREGAAERLTRARREREEVRRTTEAAESERAASDRKREACHLDSAEARAAIEELEERRAGAERRLRSLAGEVERARAELERRRRLTGSFRQELERYQADLQAFRLKESESRVRLENLMERVGDECGVRVSELYEADGGYTEPEDLDWSDVERRIEELKTRLARLGHVNLEAIEELDELDEKARFLTAQKEDLVGSRDGLVRVIREINQRCRTLFTETFASIREAFQRTFRKLFGGGRADVSLVDEDDPLESGIEIVARPPGKELRSIDLLSGGERTMTAVALLFGIFEARPSPYAILDEVDAALDEANIDRFLGLLASYSKSSQFIIVSHSRRTMSVADTLFGITMEESGVSRKVAVKFEDVRDVTDHAAVEAGSGAADRSE